MQLYRRVTNPRQLLPMTTKEIAARARLSESQIRTLAAEGKLPKAGRNNFDDGAAAWAIADYWREKANPQALTDEEINALLAAAFPNVPG